MAKERKIDWDFVKIPSKNVMGHQINQQNVLNVKMCVVGAKNHCSFQQSTVVDIGQIWPAKFRHRHFVICPPPPPRDLSLQSH